MCRFAEGMGTIRESLDRSESIAPNYLNALYRAVALAYLGRKTEAEASLDRFREEQEAAYSWIVQVWQEQRQPWQEILSGLLLEREV